MPVPQTQIVPTEHSLRLYQLTDIIKNKNPELWGFAREQVTSLEQQRSSLQERLKDTSLNVVEKLEIDDQLKHINLYLGEEDIDISDDDVSMLILSSPDFGMPNREQREGLQDLLIATVEAKGPADKSFAVVTGMWEAMKRIDIEPFLIGAMHTATMPKDTPQERKQYEIKAHSKMLRADKLRTKIEAAEQSQKPPDERILGLWKSELSIVDDWLDKHPEWKELDPYPESALTPGQAKWKKASDRMIEEAREDLENVSLLDAKTLAFYKWSRTKDLREFMDIFDRGLQLDVIGWNIGRGLGSFIPALTAGVATGLITKSPTTGLAVGRTAMGMMEGSDEFNQAIDYAIQNGLDLDEARHTASHSAIAYGIGSAWMEGWAPGRMIKRMGMTTKKPIRDMLGKMFYDRVNKKSVIKYRNMKSSFGKAMGKVPAFVEGSLTESMQELSQYLYQVSLQAGYQDVGETYLDRYTEIYDPSEAATSFYAGGLLGGAMGTAADVVTQVKKRAVKKAEKLEKRIIELEEKEEDIGIEPEEVYSDDPMQDYLIRMSDIRKEQLAPPAPGEGATALEATIYEQQDAPTSVDKLYGLLQSVEGVKAVKEINKMDDADKSSLLDIVLGYIKKENPKSKVDTREDALKYLQAFAQGGKRVTTAKRIGLEEPVISAKTKFDPSKMAPSLREDMAKFGLPKDVYKMPPPAVAPITKKAPPISKKPTIPKEPIIPKGPPIIEAPPITEAPPIREEPPIPTEPTPAQLAKMAAAKKPAVAPSVKPEVVTKPVQELVDKLPLQKGQKEKLKRGYKWFAIGVGETVKGKFVEERIVRAQGKEIKLKGSPKNLTWFVNRGYDGLWRVTNVETGKSISSLGFGDTIKAAIGFAESEISSPQNIERLKEIVPTSQFAKETGMIKPEVAPPVTPIKAPSVEYQDVIVSKKQDRIVGAQADYKNNRILVSKKDLQKKFKEKAWTKPKVKGVDPLPKDAFKTYEEWEDFAIAHERAHFTQENRAIKNLAERENDANRIALGEIAAVAPPVTPIKAPPVVKALTDVKAYMQNRRKLDEEPSNIVYNAKQSRLTLKYGSNAEIQKEISRLDTLIPLIEKNPTEYIPRKGFWQRGDSIEKRLARLKDIKNQLVDKLKAPAVVKVTPEDVHKAAEAVGMAWDDDAAFMALSKRVTGKDRIDDMTSGERASLIAEISKEVAVATVAPPVTKPPVKAKKVPVVKKPVVKKVEKSLPMNFVYGEGTALPARPDVKSKTTFDAILAGERRSTSRKDNSLNKLGVGSIIEFYAKGRKERIKAIVTQKWVPAKVIGPERWSKLEGYDEAAVKENWTSGKKLSEYVQIEFEVLEPAIARPTKPEVPKIAKPTGERKTSGEATKNLRGIKFEFDEPLLKRVMKAMPSIAEDPKLYDKIAKRLIKRIPFVIPRAALERGLKESFEYYGGDPKFLGRAFGVAVEWSAERAKVSTPPHEFFHPYFKVMGSAPIIRLAVQRFKNLPEVKSLHKRPDIRNDKDAVEEYLAQFVGPMYVKRTLATVPAKVKAWFRRFWLTLKKMFVPLKLTAKDLRTIIFEEFYRGLTPGMTAEEVSSMVEALDKAAMVQSEQYDIYDEAASHVEPVSEDGSKEGVSQEYDYRASSLIHYNTYFSESFDRYINKKHHGEMAYLAVINKEAGFNSFFEELKIWANENLLDKDGVGVDIDKIYTRQEKNYLIQFFVKSNSRIKVYDKELDRDTTGKRVYLDLFVIDPESPDFKEAKAAGQKPHEFKFTVSESEELGNNENNRRKRSSYKTSSFVELQNKARVIYLPHNNIVKVVANKKYVKADEQEAIELGKEYKHPREFVFPANMRINGGHIRRWDEIFAEDHQYEGDDLLFIAGVKGSTDGAIFMGKVSDEFTGMDEEGFRSYLDGEVDKGFMTQPQSDKMVEEISSYFLTNNQIYSQQVGKHEWWKNIKGSNYLLRLRKGKPVGIREHFNRLRIDFAEGTIPFGLGDTGIMLFDPEEITLKIDGKNISLKAYAGTYKFDGWLMSSGQFFKDLSNVIGRRAGLYENKMHEAKTMIRHLSDDLVDYLGLKMMQMTPYEGMEFFRDGEKFAEVKVRRGETVFVETATGEEFHHLGSIEEAKMLAGKFDRDTEHGGLSDEDGFYKVNTLGEQDIKVLFVTPEKSKENSAYPVAEGDLTLDPDLAGNPDYEKFMTALNAHYKNVGDVWIEDLFNMHDNPRILRDAIYKPVTAGAIPTELQEIVELLGPTGVGLHLPYVMSIAESYLNNIFINDGLNKVRQMNGMSTNLKLKPRIGGIKGTVGVSASNSVVFDRAKKLYIESEIVLAASQITTFEDEGVQIAIDEFEGKPLSEQIDSINEVLKRRPIYAKFSRQPVTGSTVTIMRKINELTVGHGKIGEVVFMSEEDIFKIQADYDGDSVSLEMFDNSQVEKAFIEWQETDTFKARDKTAYTNVFLTKKKHTLMTTYKDFLLTVSDITVASNSQGVVTNSKVIGNILAYKEFKLKMKGDKGKLKDVTFEAVSPSEVVVMDYAPLDKESLMEKEFELFNLLNEQGDSVVTLVKGKFKEVTADEIPDIKTKLYLRTTHEHEMTNLLQLAVDDVGLGLLSKIGYNFNMLIGRMFKRSDNGRISGKGVLHVLKAARQMFNYSPTRRGVVSGEKASMDQNIVESIRINHLLESSSLERNTLLMNNLNGRSSVDHPEWVPWYRGFEVTSVSVNDKSTPTETLLTMLAKEYDKRVNSIESGDQFVAEWGGSPGTYTEATYRIAHVNAMKKLEEQWSTLAAKRGVTNAEMESGTRLMSKIDKDFRAIFKDVKKTRPGKFVRLKPEYHKPLRELIDNYIDDWNKLEDNSQMYATLYFLSGTATRDRAGKPALRVDVRRFLPLNLMHNGMWKTYAQLHWEMMMKDMNSKFKQPIDSRGETYKGFKFGKALALAKKKSEDMCG